VPSLSFPISCNEDAKMKWHYPDTCGVWHVGEVTKTYWFKDDTTGELTFRRPEDCKHAHAIQPKPKKGCPVCIAKEEKAHIHMGARYLAKRAIKHQWLRHKIKLSHVDAKDLSAAADAYLEDHRAELLEQAKSWLCKS
jgi:hypothetical protein